MIIVIVMLSVEFVALGKSVTYNVGSDARKADYIFLESLRKKEIGEIDAYYELIERAFELNPSDDYLGLEQGMRLILLSKGDSIQIEQGLSLMKRYAEANPDDFYGNVNYAALALRTGHVNDALAVWARLYKLNPSRPEVAATYADNLAATAVSENMSRAIDVLNDLEKTEGISPDISARKMRIYGAKSDTAAIKTEARTLLASNPSSVEYTAFVGRLYMDLGDPDSALVFFNKAVDLDPSSGLAYYYRAGYYNEINDSVAYDREVFLAMTQPDLDLEPKLEILRRYVAQLYSDTLQQPRINNLFLSLLEQYPHEVNVRKLYSDYLMAIGDYANAAEQLEYAVDADPSDSQRWVQLAALYAQLTEYDKVITTVNRGLYYFPEEIQLYLSGSFANTRLKNYPGAMEYIDRAEAITDIDNREMLSEIMTSRGDTYYVSGSADSAFVCYEKAIELNPENLMALNNCAYYLACEERELDRAERMVKHVLEVRPDDISSLDTYAWVLFKKRNYQEAKKVIDSAIESDPDSSAEMFEHAGDIYFMSGDPDGAVEFWRKALEIEPDNQLLIKKVKNKTFFYK